MGNLIEPFITDITLTMGKLRKSLKVLLWQKAIFIIHSNCRLMDLEILSKVLVLQWAICLIH